MSPLVWPEEEVALGVLPSSCVGAWSSICSWAARAWWWRDQVPPTLVSTVEFAFHADGKIAQKIGPIRAARGGALFYAR